MNNSEVYSVNTWRKGIDGGVDLYQEFPGWGTKDPVMDRGDGGH